MDSLVDAQVAQVERESGEEVIRVDIGPEGAGDVKGDFGAEAGASGGADDEVGGRQLASKVL